MKIIIDAMGGDNAPSEIVKGALLAIEEYGVEVILTGRKEAILNCLRGEGISDLPESIRIADCDEVIAMDEDPVTSVRKKRNSSMVVGLEMLKNGEADAMVSAGSTGALLTGATLYTKRIQGIRRAALAPYIPCRGGGVLLADCGANVECTPEYLLQFAYMGSFYMEKLMGVTSPRVGLVNNGTEPTKGTALQKETYALLQKANDEGRINFIGNVEAKEIPLGGCDVAV
ncbi:MAG: phosphate acyltransferase, partial [Oscillospiraceae bacterium]|nr:phosphate acyltransferase [Oscillospiraceae bacterium]